MVRRLDSPSPVIAAGMLAWVVMMAAGLATGLSVETAAGHFRDGSTAEYTTAFLIAMPFPSLLAIGLVYAPLVVGMRRWCGWDLSPLAAGLVGAASAPIAGCLLIGIGLLL